MAPEDAIHFINTYLARMEPAVLAEGGFIDNYVGDAIMAVFGAPVPRTTPDAVAADARAAVACAQAFGPALATLNRTFAADGLPTVAMRVGINTGPVVAGGLGGRARMNYTVLGDTVNVAARLESFDKTLAGDRDCRVLIAERTRVLVGDAVEAHPVGALALKGRHDRVRVFLVGAAPTADAVVVPAGTAPMAGEGTRQ
jgi:adenylate cyclase